MRIQLIAIVAMLGCQGGPDEIPGGPDAALADEATASVTTDHLKEIFDEVDGARITQLMRELSGTVAVTVNGASIKLGERFDSTGRKKFRDYWTQTSENLAAGSTGLLDPEAVVKMWYDERAQYKFPNGGFSMQTGHFTQVVWRGTTQVGCGRSQCKGLDIWVCEYDPPGNWEGQYRENVRPLGCR